MAQFILRLDSLPPSTDVVECVSPFTTDVLASCYIEINPDEFELLLRGWSFEQQSRRGSTKQFWPALGAEFEIAGEYAVSPREFEHGGQVSVVYDSTRRMVVADYYEE